MLTQKYYSNITIKANFKARKLLKIKDIHNNKYKPPGEYNNSK